VKPSARIAMGAAFTLRSKPNPVRIMKEERYEELADQFEKMIDAQVEYQESHDDAGDSYSHCPRDGGWAYNDNEARLEEWIEENGIDVGDLDLDTLGYLALDNFEMVPGHMFGHNGSNSDFVVDSYPVGEVESQFCFDDKWAIDAIGCVDSDEMREFAKLANEDSRFCLTVDDWNILSYTATDCAWYAVVSVESFKELAGDLMASK
jgi:hypothetical protein